MEKKVSLNEMIQQIREWQLETNNFRNDSWTQDAYRKKIQELFDVMAPIVNNIDSRQRHEKYTEEKDNKED